MTRILIRNGRVIDPAQQLDRVASLLIADGRVASLDAAQDETADIVLDARDRIVAPGLIDLGTELREPGFEEDETIESGTAAAIAGGFTSIACLPNTEPPIDSQASVEFVQHQAGRARQCHVYVLACVSKNRAGQELSEMGLLAQAGAVGFSDASAPVSNSELMRRALEYSQMFDRPIINQPEVPELNRDGVMHEGLVSTLLGLSGMPAEAEDVMTARDIRLAEATGGRLHLLHISSSGSVELLRRARARGMNVTAGIAAINFSLDDQALRRFDSNCKLNPPLRSSDHLRACIEGLVDNTIDVICSGHSPRAAEKKMDVLDVAPYGMAALETTLGLVSTKLIRPGHLDWMQALAKLSFNPARILNLRGKGTLAIGADADIVVIDPSAEWVVDAKSFCSKSGNTPLSGWTLSSRVTDVIVSGNFLRRDARRC
jgi:dihydroorotase